MLTAASRPLRPEGASPSVLVGGQTLSASLRETGWGSHGDPGCRKACWGARFTGSERRLSHLRERIVDKHAWVGYNLARAYKRILGAR